MRSRFIMVALAVILAAFAAVGVAQYTQGIRAKVERDNRTVQVLVAEEDIPLGVGMKEITRKKLANFREVPRKYVASNAITSTENIDGQVLAFPINEGEQITTDKFKYDTKAGLSFAIPDDHVAISIEVDDVTGVAGMIKAGDSVNVIASISDSTLEGAPDMTKIILRDVRVLAVGSTIAPQRGQAQEKKSLTASTRAPTPTKQTVTLSLSPADTEKLVFAEDQGKVWLSLLPQSKKGPVATEGQTIETVFSD